MSSLTPNYDFILPGVADPTDQDLWGGYLNSNFSSLDSLLLIASDSVTRAISTNASVTSADRNKVVVADATGGTINVALPSAAAVESGFRISVTKKDSSGNAVNVVPDGSDTISGVAGNYVVSGQGEAATLVSDGVSLWVFMGNKVSPSAVPDASTSTKGIVQLATSAEVITGTDGNKAIVPSALAGALGFTGFYDSGLVTFPSSYTATIFSHGLTNTPKIVMVEMQCVSTDVGYSAGDIINTYSINNLSGNFVRLMVTSYTATQIVISQTEIPRMPNKTAPSNTFTTITPANWRLRVRAWA